MHKILFVCHGNICRSPMAEFYMKDLVEKKGEKKRFKIESAGTSAEERDNPVYPPARRLLLAHGIDPSGKTARRVQPEDYEKFDHILVMDGHNLRSLKQMFPADNGEKITRLLDLSKRPNDIKDPWYSGDFDRTWDEIVMGCEALYERLCGGEVTK